MARKFLTPIDLTGLEILNVRFQNLATAPTPKGDGHVYYNTTDDTVYVYDGANWQASGKIVSGTLASRPSAGSSGRLYFATDATQQVLYFDNGTTWTKVGESKKYIDDSISAHNAASGIHGVTGSVVGTSDTQTLTNKTLTSPVVTGLTLDDASIVFEGATPNAFETTLSVTDPTADRTITLPDATGTVQLRVADVSDEEIAHLNGVTSAIQTQIDNKAAASDLSTHTGASSGVHGVTGNVVGTTDTQSLSNKTFIDTVYFADSVTAAGYEASIRVVPTTHQFEILANLGDLELKSSTGDIILTPGTGDKVKWGTNELQIRVENVTDTEIGYLDGVTSSIQTQIDNKAAASDLTNHTGASTGVHGITGAVVGTTDTQTLSNKTLGSDLAAGNYKITGLADPTSAQDAATKAYVDTAVQGIDWKASVRAATTAQLTIATDLENGDVIDGVTLATGNRVLVKNQSNGSQNGIYVVKATGAPDRATDADTATEVTSNFAVFVEEGTVNSDSGWTLTNDGSVTIGTTALTFTQFTGLGQITAGDGLTKTGNTLNVVAGTGITVTSDAVAIDTSVVARKYAVSVGNGALTSFVLTHGFNTRDVTVTVYDAATYAEVFTDAAHSTVNTVTVSFAEAPTTDQYRVVIVG